MNNRINFQNLFLLLAFLSLAACQPKSTDQEASSKVEVPAMTIHQAAFMADAKAIQQHIAAGTDLNQKDEYGSTALNIAATFEKTDIAQLLIEAGADLEVKSADGSTALHTAAFLGRTEIVNALLVAGANTAALNNYGSTPVAPLEVPFEQVKPVYDQLSKDLGPLGLRLNYKELEETRPLIADMIKNYQ